MKTQKKLNPNPIARRATPNLRDTGLRPLQVIP